VNTNHPTSGSHVKFGLLIFLAAITVLLTLISLHFAAEIFAIAFVVALIWYTKQPGRWRSIALGLLWLAWLLAVVSPLDIAVRQSDKFSVRWVRIVATHHSEREIRELENSGLVEGRDFVVYRGRAEFTRPRWAVAFFLPTGFSINTPLCSLRLK
jgi:energy-coupling factor transporter transmembrane protein EcfT